MRVFRGGERVRVPNPEGDGMVEAIYVAPSEPSRRHAEYVWVQLAEGPQTSLHAKVRYADVEPAPKG